MLSPESFARSQRRHATDVVRVALAGRGILGFIDIHERMTLLEARQLIWDNVEHAPRDFQFVLDDGVPVSARQESTQLILHFYPCVQIRQTPTAASTPPASDLGVTIPAASTAGHSERLSVWTAAGDEFAVWVSEDYTFQQLRRDAARYWHLPAAHVALVDSDGCLWPEQAKILAVMDADTLRQRKIILDSKGGGSLPATGTSTPSRRRANSTDAGSLSVTSPRSTSRSSSALRREVASAPTTTTIADLWGVFTCYCAAGDSLEVESLTHHQFTRLLRDARVPPAVASIIYVAETKRQGKMNFDEFLNALLNVARRSSTSRDHDDDALLQRLVLDHVLPRATRWPTHVWDTQTLLLRTPDMVACTARFLEPLLDLFFFYAKSHVLVLTAQTAKQFYLAYADFQRFVNDFAFANLQISSVETAQVYLAACASPPVHDALAGATMVAVDEGEDDGVDEDDVASTTSSTPSVAAVYQRVAATADGAVLFASAASQVGRCCMSFSAFLDALGRLGLVAFAKSRASPPPPLPAVKAVFHHLSRGLGRARVLEIVKHHGNTSIHAARFYAGSVAFTHRFLDMWRYEGSPDYLSTTSGDLGCSPPVLHSPRQPPLSPSRRLTSSAALFDERVVPNGAGRGREALDRLVRNAFVRNASKADALGPASPTHMANALIRATGGAEDSERMLFESILVKGGVFKKYGQWGQPRRRFVWCTPELDSVCWRAVDSKKTQQSTAKGGVPVALLVAVLPGNSPKTRYAFMKQLSDEKALSRCFSIVAEDKRVDLEADSETTRDLWMQALTYLMKQGSCRQ